MGLKQPLHLIASLAVVASAGCLFSPEQKPPKPEPPFDYPEQITPETTLLKMQQAYTRRDSVETFNVYDDAYSGASIDPSGLVGDFNLTKAQEVSHVGRLKKDTNIVRVQLELGNPASWKRIPADAADPPDWAQIDINFATIQVDDITASEFQSQNQALSYVFKPYVNAPGDTTWKIIRWTELVTNPPPPA